MYGMSVCSLRSTDGHLMHCGRPLGPGGPAPGPQIHSGLLQMEHGFDREAHTSRDVRSTSVWATNPSAR
jgi:hypothetical protein